MCVWCEPTQEDSTEGRTSQRAAKTISRPAKFCYTDLESLGFNTNPNCCPGFLFLDG